MEVQAAKMIGAGLALIALLGVGMGIGSIFSSLITAVGRNPSAKNDLVPLALIGFAGVEILGLLAFVVAAVMVFVQ